MMLPLINHDWKIGTEISLAVILGVLATSIVASLLRKTKGKEA